LDIVRNGELEATNCFIGFPGDEAELELTFNHDGRTYDLGTGYGHIAIAVDDLDETLARLREQRIEPEREPYPRARGSSGSMIGHSSRRERLRNRRLADAASGVYTRCQPRYRRPMTRPQHSSRTSSGLMPPPPLGTRGSDGRRLHPFRRARPANGDPLSRTARVETDLGDHPPIERSPVCL
jgi:catechol 2,3-dioxygenase-like lactoylglutathione lyase family enzyme